MAQSDSPMAAATKISCYISRLPFSTTSFQSYHSSMSLDLRTVYHAARPHRRHEGKRLVFDTLFFFCSESLTAYQHPSVMDIKLGIVSWLPTMTPAKIEYAKSKTYSSTSAALGYRITGMKVRCPPRNTYIEKIPPSRSEHSKRSSPVVPHAYSQQ